MVVKVKAKLEKKLEQSALKKWLMRLGVLSLFIALFSYLDTIKVW